MVVVVVDCRHLPTGRAGLAWRAIMASSAAARGRGSSQINVETRELYYLCKGDAYRGATGVPALWPVGFRREK
jgi:hypothetical protein